MDHIGLQKSEPKCGPLIDHDVDHLLTQFLHLIKNNAQNWLKHQFLQCIWRGIHANLKTKNTHTHKTMLLTFGDKIVPFDFARKLFHFLAPPFFDLFGCLLDKITTQNTATTTASNKNTPNITTVKATRTTIKATAATTITMANLTTTTTRQQQQQHSIQKQQNKSWNNNNNNNNNNNSSNSITVIYITTTTTPTRPQQQQQTTAAATIAIEIKSNIHIINNSKRITKQHVKNKINYQQHEHYTILTSSSKQQQSTTTTNKTNNSITKPTTNIIIDHFKIMLTNIK